MQQAELVSPISGKASGSLRLAMIPAHIESTCCQTDSGMCPKVERALQIFGYLIKLFILFKISLYAGIVIKNQ